MNGTYARNAMLAVALPTGSAYPVDAPALALRYLDVRLKDRGWASELVSDGEDTVLRLRPPTVGVESDRSVEVVIRDRGHGPYFADAKAPRRPIADIDDLERAVRVLEHVHRSEPPPAPPIPEGLGEAASSWAGDSATDTTIP